MEEQSYAEQQSEWRQLELIVEGKSNKSTPLGEPPPIFDLLRPKLDARLIEQIVLDRLIIDW